MLEEEVIFTFVIEQAVGVIHPITQWGEVKLRSVFFVTELSCWVRNHGQYLILAT